MFHRYASVRIALHTKPFEQVDAGLLQLGERVRCAEVNGGYDSGGWCSAHATKECGLG